MSGGVQFSSTRQPANPGRTPTRFLRERLNRLVGSVPTAAEFCAAARLTEDTTIRDALVDRLLSIAFTDRVFVVGYDRETRGPIERVSSAECVKAIETLWKYDMGSGAKTPSMLEWAEHLRTVERDRISTVLALLGHKLRDKTPAQIAEYFDKCVNDPRKFVDMAEKLVGEGETEQPAQLPEQPEGESKP